MKLRLLLLAVLVASAIGLRAQVPQPAAADLAKSIQQFVKTSGDLWIKNYEALQKQEMTWFGLSKFNKVWDLEPNLSVTSTGRKDAPYAIRFDPLFPGDKHHPVWHTYDLSACLHKAAGAVTMLDFDLVFLADSTWRIRKVQPGIKMLDEGKSRHMGPTAIYSDVWKDCMQPILSDMERSQPALVGNRWTKTQAFLAKCEGQKEAIWAAITAAVKQKYTTAPVTEVMACMEPIAECFDVTDPERGQLKIEGIFKAGSGPGMLYYNATITVGDDIRAVVDRIWK